MLDASRLNILRQTNIETVDKSELVDASTLQIDAFAPLDVRAKAFFEQIKNPYAFRVGNTAVKIQYRSTGITLSDALLSYLTTLRQDT